METEMWGWSFKSFMNIKSSCSEQHVQRLGGKRDQETSEKLKAVPTNIKWHTEKASFL